MHSLANRGSSPVLAGRGCGLRIYVDASHAPRRWLELFVSEPLVLCGVEIEAYFMATPSSSEIWACFSVFDHVQPGAFLSEAVMYDRLVIPVPPRDEPAEWQRWEDMQWDPARQEQLLEVLDPIAERVEWNEIRRYRWEQGYRDRRSSAGEYVKRTLAGEETALGLFDVTPHMARPVVATSPYKSLKELTDDLGIRREASHRPLPASTVSAVVGRELLLPQDGSRTELQLLQEVVRVVTGDTDYRNARYALNTRLQKFCRGGFTDHQSITTAVTEIKEACDELTHAVRKRKIWVTSRRLFSFAQIALGAALTPLSPIAVGLVVAGLGQFTATEMLSDPEKPESRAPDLAMLLDVQHELNLET
jgi:hypothetical protein